MSATLTLLHTSPVHIATFDRLLAELAPDIPARHVVDEQLLDDARAHGITADVERRVAAAVDAAAAGGALVVLCTCSTIGGCAERPERAGTPAVLRVDRPMAERAVSLGGRIIVAAALASTLGPTCRLLLEAAERAGTDVTLAELLCEGAWPHFERGDHDAYHRAIAEHLRRAAPAGDVIVLAQASMAGAAAHCPELTTPILSSPRIGLEAAIRAYRAAV